MNAHTIRPNIGRNLLILAVLMMAVLPLNLMARGAAEGEPPYGLILEEEFSELLLLAEEGTIGLEEAMARIQELRQENEREDGEEYREMEQILAMVMEKTMTAVQARERFYELEESNEGLTALQQRERVQKVEQLRQQGLDQGRESSGNENVPETVPEEAANPAEETSGGTSTPATPGRTNPPAQGGN